MNAVARPIRQQYVWHGIWLHDWKGVVLANFAPTAEVPIAGPQLYAQVNSTASPAQCCQPAELTSSSLHTSSTHYHPQHSANCKRTTGIRAGGSTNLMKAAATAPLIRILLTQRMSPEAAARTRSPCIQSASMQASLHDVKMAAASTMPPAQTRQAACTTNSRWSPGRQAEGQT